jgi:hypothetical protein
LTTASLTLPSAPACVARFLFSPLCRALAGFRPIYVPIATFARAIARPAARCTTSLFCARLDFISCAAPDDFSTSRSLVPAVIEPVRVRMHRVR